MGMDIYGMNPFPLKGKEIQGKAAEEALLLLQEKIGTSFNTLDTEQKKAVTSLEEIVDKYNPGHYFRANLWAWRPIHMLCETVIAQKKLEISTAGWGENSGYGISEQETCDELANALDSFLAKLETCMHIHPFKETKDLRLYINMMVINDDYTNPFGISYSDGKFVSAEDWTEATAGKYKKYLKGRSISHNLEVSDFKIKDKTVVSSYSVSYEHVRDFSVFLKHCGGFNIH